MKDTITYRSLLLALACSLSLGFDPTTQGAPLAQSSEVTQRTTDLVVEETNPAEVDSNDDAPKVEANESDALHKGNKTGIRSEEVVSLGKSVVIKSGDTAGTVVVIGGSATIDGKVDDAVVAIGGDVTVNGEVSDTVVSVLGNIKLGPEAKIGGEAVSVGGRIDKAEGAVISGETQQIDFGVGFPEIKWLRDWFVQCVLKLRPLAPQVGWVWVVAGVMFALYFLIAIAFPRPVQACVDELVRRPATTFLLGLLTKILAPFAILLLIATGVGAFVVPFLLAALFLFAVVGKIALLEGLGFQIGKQFGGSALQKPLTALLLGSIIIVLLYLVPVVGLITWMILGLWGLGIAVSASFGGLKRERPPKQPASPAPMAAAGTPVAPMQTLATNPGETYANGPVSTTSPLPTTEFPAQTALVPGTIPPPVMPEILAFPRAGFWERIGAAFLDIVIVVLLSALVGGMPLGLLVALAYFTGMWTWKGTTIGGIVLGLKVVRIDGQPLLWHVALVRALAGAFSAFVLFLGFLWIAWDKEKQGWHDMIAGTVVLRLPRGMPLVCI